MNRERVKRRREEAFNGASGEKASWIRGHACVVLARLFESPAVNLSIDAAYAIFVASGCSGERQAMHVKSRGAGGKSNHLVPACAAHHLESHNTGIKTFAAKYELDLETLAAHYEKLWVDTLRGDAAHPAKAENVAADGTAQRGGAPKQAHSVAPATQRPSHLNGE